MSEKGVLLVNLGTPDSYSYFDVFRYLSEFLTDPRVIDIPWIRRQFLVRGLIIPFRFRQSAEQYRKLWTERGSPLLFHSIDLRDHLQKALGPLFKVALAMRYQSPSIFHGLEELRKQDVKEIIIIPLFPQYASATTGSVHQKVMQYLQKWSIIPKLTFIDHYYDYPLLIDAFCERAKQYHLENYDHFLFSFHGLPERQIRKADRSGKCLSRQCCDQLCKINHSCYRAQCHATAHAVSRNLGFEKKDYTICFQSRLGKEPWIQPYLSDVLESCVSRGLKRLLVFSPSFVCDCLETTIEITHEYGQKFKERGGEYLHLVEGLNSHPTWIEALRSLILNHQFSSHMT